MKVENIILGIGRMARRKDKELNTMLMGLYTEDFGRVIISMEKAKSLIRMEKKEQVYGRETGSRDKKLDVLIYFIFWYISGIIAFATLFSFNIQKK